MSTLLIKKYIRENYGLAITGIRWLKSGIANRNYLIITRNKKYLFKIYSYRTLAQTEFELKVSDYLHRKRFPSPAVVKNRNTKLFGQYDGKPCALFIYVDGQILKKISPKILLKIGRQIALLHKLLKNKKETVRRENWDLASIKNKVKKFRPAILKKSYPNKREIIDFLDRELAKIDLPVSLPSGLTHQDIKPDNIVVDKRGKIHFIDFDNMYYGSLLVDFMTTVIWTCFTKNKFNHYYFKFLIKGYEQQRKFSTLEKKYFDQALRFRLLRETFIWIWLYSDKKAQRLCNNFLSRYRLLFIS